MKRWVGVAALLALAGCGEKTVVTGTVHDNFGDPVAGVDVLVEGREMATTGTDGAFEFMFAPGRRVPLRVEGEGYAAGDYTLAIGSQGAPVDLVVQRMPPAPGLWAVDAEGYHALRNCTQTSRPYDSANMRYFVDEGIPAEVVPDIRGIVMFVDTGEPVGGLGTRMARVNNDHLFYRTERTIATLDTVFTENVLLSEVTPAFKSSGRWFNARLPEGTYVQYDRVAIAPFSNVVPNAEGRCYLMRVGEPAAQWLDDAITDEQFEAFKAHLKTCFRLPPDDGAAEQVVTVRVALNPDGSVSQASSVRGPLDTIRQGTTFLRVQAAAAAAVQACGPYTMFAAEAYDAWDVVTVALKAAELAAQ